MKKFLLKLITANSGVSSKRVAGLLGWIIVLFIGTWCTIKIIEAPNITNEILWGSVALLGTDAVTKIWRKNDSKTNSENKEEE